MALEEEPAGRRGSHPLDDLPVRICALLAFVATALFAVDLWHPFGAPVLLWVTVPLSGPIVALLFWRAGDGPATGPANRRFWRRLSPVPVLVALGQIAQAVDTLLHPDVGGDHTTPAVLAFHGPAVLLVLWAMTGLGDRAPDRATVFRTALDAATVMLATSVFIWHFVTRPAIGRLSHGSGTAATGAVTISLILIALASFTVFAMARMLLSTDRVVDRRALRILGVAVVFAILASSVQPSVGRLNPDLYTVQFSVPITLLLGALAARYQRRAVPTVRRVRFRALRSFSLLPYTAVAAVDALLLVVATTDRADIVPVASTAVTLTGPPSSCRSRS